MPGGSPDGSLKGRLEGCGEAAAAAGREVRELGSGGFEVAFVGVGHGRLLRVLAGVYEFEPQAFGQWYAGPVVTVGRLRDDPDLDAVAVADPERGGGAADGPGVALGAPGVGGVLGIVGLQVLPVGPTVGADGAGADLDGAVEFDVGVVPDDADQ